MPITQFLTNIAFVFLDINPTDPSSSSDPHNMMDESRGSFLGLGGYGGGGSGGLSKLSPYLNVDPTYLQTESPEYIFNQVSQRDKRDDT